MDRLSSRFRRESCRRIGFGDRRQKSCELHIKVPLFGRTLKSLALEFRNLCFGLVQFQLEFYPLAVRLSEFRGKTCGFLFEAIDLRFYLIG